MVAPNHAYSRRELMAGLASLATLAGLPGRALGLPKTAAEREIVIELGREVWSLLQGQATPDRVERLRQALTARTDVRLLSRLALGRNWRQLDDQQRTAYQQLFDAVVIRSLARRLDAYAADVEGRYEDHFMVTDSHPVGRQDALVRTKLSLRSRPSVTIDWRLRQSGGRAAIIDVIIEGVSLLVTQRADFAAILERGGPDGLLANLRARAETS